MKYHLLALVIVAIWGLTFISTKVLILSGLTPAEIFFVRFLLAYLGMLLFHLVRRIRWFSDSIRDELKCLLLGVCGGSVYFLTENTALRFTQASNASFLVSTAPLLTDGRIFESQPQRVRVRSSACQVHASTRGRCHSGNTGHGSGCLFGRPSQIVSERRPACPWRSPLLGHIQSPCRQSHKEVRLCLRDSQGLFLRNPHHCARTRHRRFISPCRLGYDDQS